MNLGSHILGYPRIGAGRALKQALERYWHGQSSQTELLAVAEAVEQAGWQDQREAGLSVLTVGDFVLYDHVLALSVRLGVLPQRFAGAAGLNAVDRQFYLARGRAPQDSGLPDVAALEMTKWFDTNYHYLVPELTAEESFAAASFDDLLAQVQRARAFAPDLPLKVVLTGPLTFLFLSRRLDQGDTLALLPALLPVYARLLSQLRTLGVSWVQLDEPILALDLSPVWQTAFERTYHQLQFAGVPILLASYFGPLLDHTHLVARLPVQGIHVDLTREPHPEASLAALLDQLPAHKLLSLGLVDGRNVWSADQTVLQPLLLQARQRHQGPLWVGSSCSLLHVPLDVQAEGTLPAALQGQLAFARQKLDELAQLAAQSAPAASHPHPTGQNGWGLKAAQVALSRRSTPFAQRQAIQQQALQLPLLPTTTIGSFPQTAEIRKARADWKAGRLSTAEYELAMQAQIRAVIAEQEALGLDVLVHGEAERSDMVEYFAELLDGVWVSAQGWVQSYGSRCVRPPVIFAGVTRPQPMTIRWATHAQQQTSRPVKGMLTGPVTLLNWSFAPRGATFGRARAGVAAQLAEAVRQEVADLQAAGIAIIQIDEPAFREGLPLRQADQPFYWDWAVASFAHAASSAQDHTQIHTHMCYSEFTDCLPQITAMDADVITVETSRSGLQLLGCFAEQGYPNAIGPGVYDIHSPRIPTAAHMQRVVAEALRSIPAQRLWINPDCGLKTRNWTETRAALAEMVQMARQVRAQLGHGKTHPLPQSADVLA